MPCITRGGSLQHGVGRTKALFVWPTEGPLAAKTPRSPHLFVLPEPPTSDGVST